MGWQDHLNGDPLPWLLDHSNPAVRAATLQRLLDAAFDDPEVVRARREAMHVDPIASILAAQQPDGWWEKPGPGYSPKYRSTVWQLIFLEQLGADPSHPQVRRACEYVMRWAPTPSGGFASSGVGQERNPPPSRVIHCLNGNLLHALIAFGHLEAPAVQAGVHWAARSILGTDEVTYYRSGTSGPGFACVANDGLPCAWGAIKELGALALIPQKQRSTRVGQAIEAGVEFLLSRDPAAADYPMGYGNTKPAASWFRFGFPSAYVADVLQNLEVLAALGHARDARLDHAYELVLSGQDDDGRWRNRYAYNGRTTVDIERQGEPSKWVTLRACAVLKARYG
ncbi:MAG: nitrogen fixation protein NifH [Dehalococcoidia bacterium]|nr:nitrogen fixation protein NifH [Dehalococcoidia bacterium]